MDEAVLARLERLVEAQASAVLEAYSSARNAEAQVFADAVQTLRAGQAQSLRALFEECAGDRGEAGGASPWWDTDLRAVLPRGRGQGVLAGGWWRRDLAAIRGVTVHHTLSHDPEAVAAAYVRKGGGRPSIPYHIWVTREGAALYCLDLTEGCWHDHSGHENVNVSLGMAGILDATPPTAAQVATAARVTRALIAALPGLEVGGVFGHCHYTQTRCPGWGSPGRWLPWRHDFFAALLA